MTRPVSAPHALVVPTDGQGHVNAALLLARSLASTGFSVSVAFFSTSYSNLQKKKLLSPPQNPSIRFHVVPDGFENGEKPSFFAFTPTMREGLEQLLEKLSREDPVTCVISDAFFPLVQDVADKFGLPRIDFCTSTAFSYLMISNLALLYTNGILPAKGSRTRWKSEEPQMVDCIPGLPPFPVDHYCKEMRFSEVSDPFTQFVTLIGEYSNRAERVLIHTIQELETTALAAFGEVGMPAYSIGPLLHDTPSSAEAGVLSDEECLKWLDSQADSSVIYVAFGSFAALTPEETKELALGLEASEQAFLWVIRVQDGVASDVALPEGFLERTKGRGKLVEWAPQLKVLKHAAVGGFLTHCGWNSTMESIWEGVALLGCPRTAEQNANVHYIAQEWKIGIELERTEDGGLDRRDVERGVRTLMLEDEGSKVRCRAQEVKQAARKACVKGGSSFANLEKFYHDMCSRVSALKQL